MGSPDTCEDRSPLDRSWKLADIARGGADTADAAVSAAVDAFPDRAALGPDGRAEHLNRRVAVIEANSDRVAEVECADIDMVLESLRARVVARGAANLRNYAGLAVAHEERVWGPRAPTTG